MILNMISEFYYFNYEIDSFMFYFQLNSNSLFLKHAK